MKRIFVFIVLFGILVPGVEAAGWGEPEQIAQGYDVTQVSFTSEGNLLFVSNNSVFLANPEGGEVEELFSYEGIRRASMNPEGKVVFDNDFDIFIMDSDGVKPLAQDPDIFEFAVSFSPAGEITFVTIDDVNLLYGIWIMNADGSNKRNLLSSEENIFRHPRTSPDGSRISYFITGKGKTPSIWVMNADGSASISLTPKSDISRQASWSPGGKELVYSSKAESFDLWIMNADGTGKRQITSLEGDEAKPVFSLDGESIAFVCSGCENQSGSSLFLVSKARESPPSFLFSSPSILLILFAILVMVMVLVVIAALFKRR